MKWYNKFVNSTVGDEETAWIIIALGLSACFVASGFFILGTDVFGDFAGGERSIQSSLALFILITVFVFGVILTISLVDVIINRACRFITDNEHAPKDWLLHKLTLPKNWSKPLYSSGEPYLRCVLFGIMSGVILVASILLALPPFVSIVLAISAGTVYALLWLARAVYRLNKTFVAHENDPNAHNKGEK
jgi:hypothetical protein